MSRFLVTVVVQCFETRLPSIPDSRPPAREMFPYRVKAPFYPTIPMPNRVAAPQTGTLQTLSNFSVRSPIATSLAYCCICWASCVLCSWKRSLTRCCEATHFWTQRLMQPFSRDETALEVKSSTQEVKQWSTRPPKACVYANKWLAVRASTCGAKGRTYAHKLLNLALLHALLERALLGGCQSDAAGDC